MSERDDERDKWAELWGEPAPNPSSEALGCGVYLFAAEPEPEPVVGVVTGGKVTQVRPGRWKWIPDGQ